jgi:hypothetical protein
MTVLKSRGSGIAALLNRVHRCQVFVGHACLPLANTSFRPGQPRMSGLNYPLYLHNPGLRFCFIPEVREEPALSVGFHHLDADPLVVLRDQSEDRFGHAHV